jgi:hypothetical protein
MRTTSAWIVARRVIYSFVPLSTHDSAISGLFRHHLAIH